MAQQLTETSTSAEISPQEISPISAPVPKSGRKGFLPFRTNTWDRFFVSVICYVAINLLWMRFLEPYLFPHNIWLAVILSIVLAVFIIRRG
jgi:predicted small integral membrane protein